MAEQRDFGGLREVLYEDVFLGGLSVVGYWLSVIGYLLSVIRYSLSVITGKKVYCLIYNFAAKVY